MVQSVEDYCGEGYEGPREVLSRVKAIVRVTFGSGQESKCCSPLTYVFELKLGLYCFLLLLCM